MISCILYLTVHNITILSFILVLISMWGFSLVFYIDSLPVLKYGFKRFYLLIRNWSCEPIIVFDLYILKMYDNLNYTTHECSKTKSPVSIKTSGIGVKGFVEELLWTYNYNTKCQYEVLLIISLLPCKIKSA